MPEKPTEPKSESREDHASVFDSFSVIVKCGDEVLAVRTQGIREHAVAADVGDQEDIVLKLSGSPSHGEENVRRAAGLLMKKLQLDGGSWGEPRILAGQGARAETGIDFEVDGPDGALLHAQVTRADSNPQLWARLAEVGRIQGRYGLRESANAIRDAIEKKKQIPQADRRTLCLVLDATLVAGQALSPVIEEFRRAHGAWARGLGFQAIWCVGPVPELVWRLDEG